MGKLTQKDLDKMVLKAIREGEGKTNKPSALSKLLEMARVKKAEKETEEGITE